ncbi:hypothetical protein BGX26_008484 [Mortierella sp. AD094]|nr:hypothetical protein BGX26_008484 [Mortierella sp. AD094]
MLPTLGKQSKRDVSSDTTSCEKAKQVLNDKFAAAQEIIAKMTQNIPIIIPIAQFLKDTVNQQKNAVYGVLELSKEASYVGIVFATKAAVAAITPFTLPNTPLAPLTQPLADTMKSIDSAAKDVLNKCKTN